MGIKSLKGPKFVYLMQRSVTLVYRMLTGCVVVPFQTGYTYGHVNFLLLKSTFHNWPVKKKNQNPENSTLSSPMAIALNA